MNNQQKQPALQVQDLQVSYGKVRALTGVDLCVESSTICALVGMNGSGKSTFFKAVMGLVKPRKGQILVCGTESLSARKKGMLGYVPQNEEIDQHFPLSVWEVAMMGRYCFMGPVRRAKTHDREAVARALEIVGLTKLKDRPIGALSGGQRKRAFVARAVAQGAKVMLLDEPFAGVDYTSQEVIVDLLRNLCNTGTTVVVSTHDLVSIPTFAHEVALINQRIVGRGKPEEALTPNALKRAFTRVQESARCESKTHYEGEAQSLTPQKEIA